jgi:hypothetical protein
MAETRTGSQLRDDIDSGRTGDKIAFPDPATVPLETDAEAGGAPITAFPAQPTSRPQKRPRPFPALAMFLALGFAVDFCVLVSVLIGTS